MTLTTEELKALLEKAEKATPGPWTDDICGVEVTALERIFVLNEENHLPCFKKYEDAKFIASANPDTIKALVTELLELRESDRRKTEALKWLRKHLQEFCEARMCSNRCTCWSCLSLDLISAALGGEDEG